MIPGRVCKEIRFEEGSDKERWGRHVMVLLVRWNRGCTECYYYWGALWRKGVYLGFLCIDENRLLDVNKQHLRVATWNGSFAGVHGGNAVYKRGTE